MHPLDTHQFAIQHAGHTYNCIATPQGNDQETYYNVELTGPDQTDTLEMRLNPDTCEFHIANTLLAEAYSDIELLISRAIINQDL